MLILWEEFPQSRIGFGAMFDGVTIISFQRPVWVSSGGITERGDGLRDDGLPEVPNLDARGFARRTGTFRYLSTPNAGGEP